LRPVLLSAASVLFGFVGSAVAQTATDVTPNAEGRIIADRLCARCHAIDPGAASPVAQAPPLWRIGQRYPVENLAESMAEGMVTGHGPVVMPSFELDTASIDALLAYMASIQQR
jgi:mono/diheme cytochrome c family protein